MREAIHTKRRCSNILFKDTAPLNDNDNDNEVYSYPVLQACEIYTCTNIKLKIYNTKYTTTSSYKYKYINSILTCTHNHDNTYLLGYMDISIVYSHVHIIMTIHTYWVIWIYQ